jgi:hypothetical protein
MSEDPKVSNNNAPQPESEELEPTEQEEISGGLPAVQKRWIDLDSYKQ